MGIPERWKGHKPLPKHIRQLLPTRLTPLFERDNVELAYVFGSLARNNNGHREPHDLDLAVLPVKRGTESGRNLWEDIMTAVGTDRVDLINLAIASPVLRYEIMSTGKPIYIRDQEAKEAFEMNTLREYRDTAYMRQEQMKDLRKRMVRWVSEGSP